MGKQFLLPCLILLLLVPQLLAQHMNEEDSPCADRGPTTVDLVACLSKARSSADAKLNETYKKTLFTLRTRNTDAEQLRKAERLWLQYRDANCEAERDLYDGGTGRAPAYLACMEAMTRARTKELDVTYGWLVNKFGNSP